MKMHVLSGGRLRMRSSTYFADAPKEQTQEFPCSCYLLRHTKGNVLFDTGCHPDVETDAQSRWGGIAKAIVPVHAQGDNVLGGLGRIGLSADDIDIVVNSHLHMDHCGCNAFFRKAQFVVHERELAVAGDPASEGKGYFRADWEQPMPVETIAGERDLFGDNRIVLTPLPGHTPGTIGALLEFDKSGSFLIAADALSVRASLTSDYAPRNNWSNDLFQASLDAIRRIEANGSTVLCGHDPEQWQALRKGCDAYD